VPVTTATFIKRVYSQSAGQREMAEEYHVFGTKDPYDARHAAGIPAYNQRYASEGGTTTNMRARTYDVETLYNGPGDAAFCRVTVRYTTPPDEEDETGESTGRFLSGWELDLSTGQEHITHVKKADRQRNFPDTADVGTAIGLNGDDIEGVDIEVPKAVFNRTKWLPLTTVITPAWIQGVYTRAGKTNDADFLGWRPGDLLFLGAFLRYTEDPENSNQQVEVEYRFLGEPTQENLEFDLSTGATATVDKKEGWEYLWFRHAKKIEDAAGGRIKKSNILSVHVAQVYDKTDFGALDIE